jgi:hypothetical protein
VKPAQAVHRDAAASSTSRSAASVGGTGTANFIPRWTNSTTLGNSLLFQTTGGNIGLGTTTPTQKFDIALGNLLVRGPQNFKAGTTAFLYVGDTSHPIEAIYNSGLAIGAFKAPKALFIADFTGNVGIGTTKPTSGILNTVANSKSVVGLSTVGWNAPSASGASGSDAIQATGGNADNANYSVTGGAGVIGTGGSAYNGGLGVAGTGGAGFIGGVGLTASGGTGESTSGQGGVGMVVNGGGAFVGGAGLQASGAYGNADCCGAAGVIATGGLPDGNGVEATAPDGSWVEGGAGVLAMGGSGVGPFGGTLWSGSGPGVWAQGGADGGVGGGDGIDAFGAAGKNGLPNGLAGSFSGDVHVSGNLKFSGTKSFRIDHPLDPANKYLYHAALESSEVLNLYTGNVALDASGEAAVRLPEWFEALNRDFRYQLTAIGAPAPNLHISQEVQNGSFRIAGGAAGMKVSWQVTGVRPDAWEKAHPMVVEEQKAPRERGYYINPELFGAPPERSIEWARHPQLMKRMREIREKQAKDRQAMLAKSGKSGRP